jgi:hypothetical protein
MGTKSSLTRENHTSGDEILTYTAATGEEVQAVVIVDTNGVDIGVQNDLGVDAGKIGVEAVGDPVVITLAAAGVGLSHILHQVAWSYAVDPVTSGNLKITDDGTTVLDLDITLDGLGRLPFAPALRGTSDTAMVITLAGASGAIGKLHIISEIK